MLPVQILPFTSIYRLTGFIQTRAGLRNIQIPIPLELWQQRSNKKEIQGL